MKSAVASSPSVTVTSSTVSKGWLAKTELWKKSSTSTPPADRSPPVAGRVYWIVLGVPTNEKGVRLVNNRTTRGSSGSNSIRSTV